VGWGAVALGVQGAVPVPEPPIAPVGEVLPVPDKEPVGMQFADAAVLPTVQSVAFELPGMLNPLP
jgi:hypothetical protein